MYVQYAQGIHPNLPALTEFNPILYINVNITLWYVHRYVKKRYVHAIAIAIARTNVPLSSARTWTPFHQPQNFAILISTF